VTISRDRTYALVKGSTGIGYPVLKETAFLKGTPTMKITHPLYGVNDRLTVSDEVQAFVDKLPELPTVERDEWTWGWYAERGVIAKGQKAPGVLPKRAWSDPTDPKSVAAVEALYKPLGGTKINRSRVAVALNFQSSNDIDRILAQLKKDGKVGTTVTPGARGVARGAIVADVVKAQAAKQAAKKAPAAKAPAAKAS
jgi:hypothetical protein